MTNDFDNFARAADRLDNSARAASIKFTAWMRYRSTTRRAAAFGELPGWASTATRVIALDVLLTSAVR